MTIREKIFNDFFNEIKFNNSLGFKVFVKIYNEEGFVRNQKKTIDSIKDKLIFGIEGKIVFSVNKFYILENTFSEVKVKEYEIYNFSNIEWVPYKNFLNQGKILFTKKQIELHTYENETIVLLVNYLKERIPNILKKISDEEYTQKQNLIKEYKRKEEERIRSFNLNKLNILNELDKDNNGEVDLIDGESFNKLLNKNQKIIIEIDKNYIQKFVKISMYLRTKKSNTQKIFNSIKDTKDDSKLNELVYLLKNQIHTYELLVFHSINMITSLVESDLITFYEIFECFDQLGVFNSNWENDVSGKLSSIGEGIKDLMYSIYHMEQSIVNSLDNLSYITQDSFEDLRNSIDSQLSSIDSSIKFNNLLTGIQTYQMYKINQNTKRIN
jgi:hypothetical protein